MWRAAALGGEPAADLIVVDDEADGILLVVREVGGGGGEFAGELELGDAFPECLKAIEAEASSTRWTRRLVSSWNCLM
jgi:hypothetical protein